MSILKGLAGKEWTFKTFCRDGSATFAARIGMIGESEVIMIIIVMSA